MRKLKRNKQLLLLVIVAGIVFAFFQWTYPYHFFHKEQNLLFLWTKGQVLDYLEGPAWLAKLMGDFLTQFYYYIGGGPLIMALSLTTLLGLTKQVTKPLFGQWGAWLIAMTLFLWEGGRTCGLAYPLSSTLALMGGLAGAYVYNKIKEGKTWRQAMIATVIVILCAWCFGYGAWVCLLLILSSGLKAKRWQLVTVMTIILFFLPRTGAPATSWFDKPDFDREYLLALDTEFYFGRASKIKQLLEEERYLPLGSYYRNLYAATQDQLPQKLLSCYQPGPKGLFIPVGPESSYLSIQFANEVWFRLGDMTMTEHEAMLGMIFSPRHAGSRMIKRLAEINLINADTTATLKYLRLLDKTLCHHRWASIRMPGQETKMVLDWLKKKRALLPEEDRLRPVDDVSGSLRHLLAANPQNRMAYDYLICYDLLNKDIDSFETDYRPDLQTSRLYAEAALIGMARRNDIRPESLSRAQIPPQVLIDFNDYTKMYEDKDPALKEKYGKTYWFYYHFAETNK